MISRTAPCPPGRDATKCTASRTYGSASEEAAPREDLAPRRHLVSGPLPQDVDPQFPRPDRDHLGGSARDDPDRHPRALQHLDPVAVPYVEALQLDPGGVVDDPSVR